MILTDLENGSVGMLEEDAYFGDPAKKVSVFAENRMDLLTELDQTLGTKGIVVLVNLANMAEGPQGQIIFTLEAAIHEIPALNRSDSGAQKSVKDIAVKIISLWRKRTPDADVWNPFEFVSMELSDVDDELAKVTWTLRFTTTSFLETVEEILGTDSGAAIVTDTGAALLLSPTDP